MFSCCWLKPKRSNWHISTDDTVLRVESWQSQYRTTHESSNCVSGNFLVSPESLCKPTTPHGAYTVTRTSDPAKVWRQRALVCFYHVCPVESQATRWAGHTGSSYDRSCVAFKTEWGIHDCATSSCGKSWATCVLAWVFGVRLWP